LRGLEEPQRPKPVILSAEPSVQKPTAEIEELTAGRINLNQLHDPSGPIACYMYAHSDSFEDYTGGIITDATQYPGITHVVSLVGWGTDEEACVRVLACKLSGTGECGPV